MILLNEKIIVKIKASYFLKFKDSNNLKKNNVIKNVKKIFIKC